MVFYDENKHLTQKELNYFYNKYCKKILNYKAIRILNYNDNYILLIVKMIDEFSKEKSKNSPHSLKVKSNFSLNSFKEFFKFDKNVVFTKKQAKISDLFLINFIFDSCVFNLSKIGKIIYVSDNYIDDYEPEYFIDLSKWTKNRYNYELRTDKLNRINN